MCSHPGLVPGRSALKTVVSSGSKLNLRKHVSSLLAALEQRACIYRPLFHTKYFGLCFSPKYDQKRFFTPFL